MGDWNWVEAVLKVRLHHAKKGGGKKNKIQDGEQGYVLSVKHTQGAYVSG